MLNAEQQDSLLVALFATAELIGHQLSSPAAQMMVQDLIEYSEADVTAALQACRRELTGKLTLAAILQRIHADDGRPERDEAWAIALQAEDERETVVATGEIMAALQAAQPVLRQRDRVGARMAFLSAYDRLVAQARAEARPVEWSVSLGHDADLRAKAIEQARDLGRIPAQEAARMIEQHHIKAVSADGLAIAGLITGTVRTLPSSEQARARLAEIKRSIRRQAVPHKNLLTQEDFEEARRRALAVTGAKS